MKTSVIFRIIVVLFVLVFFSHHFISSVYNPIKTETAIYDTVTDGLNITGLIIRNETLVSTDKDGVLHFLVNDGGRVAKSGVIANVYESEDSSITLTQIDSLKTKIADIQDILSYNDMDAVNLDVITAKVESRINELILSTADSNFDNVKSSADGLLSALNRKQAALGTDIDFSAQLQELNEQLDRLSADLPNPIGSVSALKSGYFVSKTDGYEKVFTDIDLENLTYEFLSKAKPENNENDIIGKIVSDYEWYIAAEVSINNSLSFKEGEALTLETAIKTSPELPVTVKKINISEASSKAVIIFSCNQMSSELATMRSGPMTVIKSQYSGLKIPRKALRVVDSVRGVYVKNGMQLEFIPINIVFKTENFIICEKLPENEDGLKLYDEVVVKGKNLYDGKIIS